jgi:hypothetical protein
MKQMEFANKTRIFLTRPLEGFRKVRKELLGDTLRFAAIWLVILGLLIGTIFAVAWKIVAGMFEEMVPSWLENLGYLSIPAFPVMALIIGLIVIIIGAAWLHLWVLLVSRGKGYAQTVKALVYGSVPSYVLGWIPFVNVIAAVWSIILGILGLRELHEISTGKAVAAFLIACLIPIAAILSIWPFLPPKT